MEIPEPLNHFTKFCHYHYTKYMFFNILFPKHTDQTLNFVVHS